MSHPDRFLVYRAVGKSGRRYYYQLLEISQDHRCVIRAWPTSDEFPETNRVLDCPVYKASEIPTEIQSAYADAIKQFDPQQKFHWEQFQ